MVTEERFSCPHLGIELSYQKTDIIDGDTSISLISHDSLKDILINQIPPDINVNYTFNIIKAELDHSVVICTITDNTGRRIEALGESTLPSLINDISRNYPTTMAKKRAFDQAVIDYIGIGGKVYSDLQIDATSIKNNDAPVVNYSFDDEVPADTIVITDQNGVAYDSSTNEPEVHAETNEPVNNEVLDVNPVFDAHQEHPNLKAIGDTVFTLTGKYRDKNFTISQIYDIDYKYFCNITKLTSKSPDIQRQVDLMKEYQKLMENKE